MSAFFCTREFSSATPEDRAESERRNFEEISFCPEEGICKSRRLPPGEYANLCGSPQGFTEVNYHKLKMVRVGL